MSEILVLVRLNSVVEKLKEKIKTTSRKSVKTSLAASFVFVSSQLRWIIRIRTTSTVTKSVSKTWKCSLTSFSLSLFHCSTVPLLLSVSLCTHLLIMRLYICLLCLQVNAQHYFYIKMGVNPGLFCLFSFFSTTCFTENLLSSEGIEI